jgi:hypothetical protein
VQRRAGGGDLASLGGGDTICNITSKTQDLVENDEKIEEKINNTSKNEIK